MGRDDLDFAPAGCGALLADFYELTMLQAYQSRGMNETAVFELFVRDMPRERNFLVAAGLEQAIDYLATLRFAADEIEWLRSTGRFTAEFLDSLAGLRFTGDVDAMPEGTVFFGHEPILRVTAPLREAQLVESRLMNLVHFQTVVASKAARVAIAARGRPLVDFGMRRAHGAEAALLSARAAWIGGFDGTATAEAARRYGIPVHGTMAHSFIEAHASELDAFAHFAASQPRNVALLIDTYDTERAAHKLVELAPQLAARGTAIDWVRLDSGDLALHAWRVRAILDAGGLRRVKIFASGNLDEHRVAALVASGAPIDGFGVGTRMNTSADAPFLDCAYKLQEYAGRARRKRSEGKATWPGRKQVFRRRGPHGAMLADTVALVGTEVAGEPLLVPAMRGGEPLDPRPLPGEARERARRDIGRLPPALRSLEPTVSFPVAIDPGIRTLAEELDAPAHFEEGVPAP